MQPCKTICTAHTRSNRLFTRLESRLQQAFVCLCIPRWLDLLSRNQNQNQRDISSTDASLKDEQGFIVWIYPRSFYTGFNPSGGFRELMTRTDDTHWWHLRVWVFAFWPDDMHWWHALMTSQSLSSCFLAWWHALMTCTDGILEFEFLLSGLMTLYLQFLNPWLQFWHFNNVLALFEEIETSPPSNTVDAFLLNVQS